MNCMNFTLYTYHSRISDLNPQMNSSISSMYGKLFAFDTSLVIDLVWYLLPCINKKCAKLGPFVIDRSVLQQQRKAQRIQTLFMKCMHQAKSSSHLEYNNISPEGPILCSSKPDVLLMKIDFEFVHKTPNDPLPLSASSFSPHRRAHLKIQSLYRLNDISYGDFSFLYATFTLRRSQHLGCYLNYFW